MKNKLQGIFVGMLLAALLFPVLNAYALNATRTIEANYSNIKIFIDGAEFSPKDANGIVVEPFSSNGTTYLPVRAIASALGKDVLWDGETQSIYLGKENENKPDTYLDRIQYTDFRTSSNSSQLWRINGKVTDFLGTDYTNGMLFYVETSLNPIKDDSDRAYAIIEYPLDGQYSKFHGTAVLPKTASIVGKREERANISGECTEDIYIYGDGRLLQKLDNVTTTMPMTWDISVEGVYTLTIKFATTRTYVALTDLALYK